QMPELDGLEAAARVRSAEEGTGRRVPIIAMTAMAMKGDRERCLAVGMDHYVAKPLNAAELFDALAALGLGAGAGMGPPAARLDRGAVLSHVAGDVELLDSCGFVRRVVPGADGSAAPSDRARRRGAGAAVGAHAQGGGGELRRGRRRR